MDDGGEDRSSPPFCDLQNKKAGVSADLLVIL